MCYGEQIHMTWNDEESLKKECPECNVPPGTWCVYAETVVGELSPWANDRGQRALVRNRVGQRTKRLHNLRRPKYDKNGLCRYYVPVDDKYDFLSDGDFIRCDATRGGQHLEGCHNPEK